MTGINHYNPKKRKTGRPESYLYSWVRAGLSRYVKDANRDKAHSASMYHKFEDDEEWEELSVADKRSDPLQDREFKELTKLVDDFCEGLNQRDKDIVRERITTGSDKTLGDIGDRYGVCREMIRQVQVKLKAQLIRHLRSNGIER